MLDFVNRGTSDLYNNAMYFDGIDNKVTGVSLPISDGNSIEFMLVAVNVANSPYALSDGTNSMRISSVYSVRLRVSSVNYTFGGGLSDGVTYKIKVTKSGGNVTVLVNDVSIGTQAIPDFSFDNVGNLGPTYLKGTIYNIKENDVVKYIGDGAANSNWLDQIGGNNGTVNGTPAAYTGQPFNGFVSTWYDQSGNANNATQATTTAQPKIVSAGSLVTGGLDFDGVDDFFETSLVPPNAATLIGVANWDVEDQTRMIIGARDGLTQRSYLSQASSGQSAIGVSSSALTDGHIVAGDDYLLFGAYSGSTRLLSTNGSVISDSLGSAPNNTIQGYSVGAFNTAGTNASFMDGTLAEVIVYNSDQSSSRVGIETNINAAYTIY